jgi:DNA-binding response OmpR family regulator
MKEARFKTVNVSQGSGALDVIRVEKPALIILDMLLPDYSSLAIIRRLRDENHTGRIPVILMGETMREEDALIGLEVGADLCLMEAFHPQVFVARVRSLLRRRVSTRVH